MSDIPSRGADFTPSPLGGGPSLGLALQALQQIALAINAQTQQVQTAPVKSYAFAKLPTGSLGLLAVITDSNTNAWGGVIAGGGANTVIAWFNGANWTVIGK